ncbi:MAG TPA: S1 RNA-binding domain-containing protein, partial [Saprospiraceae bacterium]|nr:S1 RNA-binding domain-containing protein [Saprospiraceae bacterium]
DIMDKALSQAREGRLHILEKLTDTIAKPNETVKPYAPKMVKITIQGKFIGAVIGPGGQVIQEMQKETGCTIVIEEEDEMGIVEILGVNQEKIDEVIQKIDDITFSPTVGETYEVKVVKILDFGAVVEFRPGKEVLLHISELAWERTENVSDVVKVGDVFEVKYFGIDPRTRKQKVSRKALLPRPPRKEGDKGHREQRSHHNKRKEE